MGYFSDPTFGELTIRYHNCMGENNNNITICYIIWIAYTGLFSI